MCQKVCHLWEQQQFSGDRLHQDYLLSLGSLFFFSLQLLSSFVPYINIGNNCIKDIVTNRTFLLDNYLAGYGKTFQQLVWLVLYVTDYTGSMSVNIFI